MTGCSTFRDFKVTREGALELELSSTYYVAVSSETEKVVYKYFSNPLDYDKYGAGREKGEARPDVPIEIVKYVESRGITPKIGAIGDVAISEDIVISYVELWGWDLRPIIKSLSISAFRRADPDVKVTVSFDEMSIFNTQPRAKSVVPKMMALLFEAPPKSNATQ
jgi:hypothetical protein